MGNSGIIKNILLATCVLLALCHPVPAQDLPHNLIFIDTSEKLDLKMEYESGIMVFAVELIGFYGDQLDEHIVLEWETEKEFRNLGFYVERRNSLAGWKEIGFVSGQGTSATVQSYFFVDYQPLEGMQCYRLRQTDREGNFTYSPVISVLYGLPVNPLTVPMPLIN